jgi:hypothetical protein
MSFGTRFRLFLATIGRPVREIFRIYRQPCAKMARKLVYDRGCLNITFCLLLGVFSGGVFWQNLRSETFAHVG